VRAVELVTAAGELVRTDREHEPDLFWALRGGGGGFGIVTAIEIDLYRTDDVFAGVLVWPADCAEVVLARYRDWTQTVPDTLSSIFRLLNAPPLPSVPEPIRGRAVVTLDAAYLGTERDGNELVRPLRQCAEPLLDTFQIMPASQVTHLHGDPESPIPGIGEGFLVDELSADAAGAFLSVGAPNTGSPLVSLELRHLGGRLAAGSPGHGALRSLDGSYALYGVGSPQNADHAVAIHAQLDAVERIMAPYACGRSYLNFADRRSDPAEAFDAAVYRRLQRVKAAYDPDDVIRSNHPIVPPDGQSDAGSVLSLR
jgi:FAD/FMN-containing dehydrogenase